MIEKFVNLSNFKNSLEEVNSVIRQGVPSAIFNVGFSAKCHIASSNEFKALYIVKDNVLMEKTAEEMRELSNKKVTCLYPKDEVLLYNKAISKYSLFKRLNALYEIEKGTDIVVTTFEALLQLFPKKLKVLTLKKGMEYNLDLIVKELVSMGYVREETLTAKSGFTLRGDILEVYPVNGENPIRFDFFGDELENIKVFELDTREKITYLNEGEILTATDVVIEQDEIEEIIGILKEEVKKSKDSNSYSRRKIIAEEIIEGLTNAVYTSGLSVLMPLLKNTTSDIYDYISKDFIVYYDECKALRDTIEVLEKEHIERCKQLISSGEAFTFAVNQRADVDELISSLSGGKIIALQTLTTQISFFNPLKTISLRTGPTAKYQLKFNEFVTDVKNWLFNDYRILICAGDLNKANKLQVDLSDNGIFSFVDNPKLAFKGVQIITDKLESGFIYHDEKFVVVGSGDLFARQVKERKLKKKKNEFFQAPEAGDYAVHEVHGIGIVKGVKRITTTEGTKDYIAVEYNGGDILYVPVEQMDVLSRYLGGDKKPSLSRIGGKDFDRIKERVKASIREMKVNLKELYNERSTKKGFVFMEDDELQELFEDKFPYELTDDQKQATQEIMEDMCSEKVMDRLVCGDVGYGKTEVAFRACFRAIVSHKQVALLAPTTILAEQHYKTACERFKDFGVKIYALNRFRTEAEQRYILNELANGRADMVIGTHRLLSSDIKFYDLGLLVLDEEQRFGVEHKEKIKTLKTNVDSLTLSATPIPRTLHMSLSGIRDISTINTPPKERLPVQTYVTEETEGLIQDAVMREVSRGGQVFILYNRVESIYSYANKLKALLPNIKLTVAHGQMDEKALEKSILEFYEGNSDVLCSTTIIENGIDLPKANTLIVIDADRLGLSTLYQLKGRVGRSNRLAHAYFTFKREKVLSETAYKRLMAIMEFTEMGSGFKIAMRDLEIRGAGNVLGREQHGHMDKVGYELYNKLLKEEMGEKPIGTVALDVRVTAYIPEDYIETASGRMDAYKEIAEINSIEDEKRVKESLYDLYGELPLEVENLISIANVKYLSVSLGAKEINVKRGGSSIVFSSIDAFKSERLYKAMEKYKNYCYPNFSGEPTLNFAVNKATNDDILTLMEEFLKYSQRKKC